MRGRWSSSITMGSRAADFAESGSDVGDDAERELLLAVLRGDVDIRSLGLPPGEEIELERLVQNLIDDVRPVYPEGVPDGAPQTAGKTGEVSMWTAAQSAYDLRLSPPPADMWAQDIQGVASAKYIHNVLSADECARFLDLAERMGFQEHNLTKNLHAAVTWVADMESVTDPLFARIQPFIPAKLQVGGRERTASGLNARLRVYRYQPDGEQTFRPHTDDSFPMSACVNDRLVWDLKEGKEASVLTFLLYLTQEFEGGHTTFFQSGRQDFGEELATVGDVAATVKPMTGSVLVFAQTCRTEAVDQTTKFTPEEELYGVSIRNADSSWIAPMHEGSPVKSKAGGQPKYVVRSDVMYAFD